VISYPQKPSNRFDCQLPRNEMGISNDTPYKKQNARKIKAFTRRN